MQERSSVNLGALHLQHKEHDIIKTIPYAEDQNNVSGYTLIFGKKSGEFTLRQTQFFRFSFQSLNLHL